MLLRIKAHPEFFRKSEIHPILRKTPSRGMFAAISENHPAQREEYAAPQQALVPKPGDYQHARMSD
jgi:hypothetical protein